MEKQSSKWKGYITTSHLGTYYYPNNDRYEGEVNNNLPNGHGKIALMYRNVILCQW